MENNETMEMINDEEIVDVEVTDLVPVEDESEYDDYDEDYEESGNPVVGALAIAGGVALIGSALYGIRKLVQKIKNHKKKVIDSDEVIIEEGDIASEEISDDEE